MPAGRPAQPCAPPAKDLARLRVAGASPFARTVTVHRRRACTLPGARSRTSRSAALRAA